MAKQWTPEENMVCFFELKDYLQCEENNKVEFVEKMLYKYPVFTDRSTKGLAMHLEYLYQLSNGEQEKFAEKDAFINGILLENNPYENTDIIEELVYPEQKERLISDSPTEESYNSAAEELSDDTITLTKEEEDSLLSFIGHGEFNNAKIAIFGNEGGLGDKSLKENIKLLTEQYKRKNENYLDREHWENGYWHIGEYDPEKYGDVPRGAFLNLVTRIILSLEDNESAIDDWFNKEDTTKREIVKKFIANDGLFSNYPRLKSALFDWRPLPRRTEKGKKFPYLNVDGKSYLKAFEFKGDPNNRYNEWVDKRITLFNHVLHEYKIPILLSFGAVKTKLTLFKKIWPEIEFKEVILEESNKKIYVSKEKVGSSTTVIATEFIDYLNLGFVGTKELVKYIKNNYM